MYEVPHIIVKLWPGRSEDQKIALANRMNEAMQEIMGIEDRSISIAFEEIAKEKWMTEVYQPEVVEKANLLYKKPGY